MTDAVRLLIAFDSWDGHCAAIARVGVALEAHAVAGALFDGGAWLPSPELRAQHAARDGAGATQGVPR